MTEQNHSYTVLARRYRPQTFSEVVGQQHVAQALKNAIQQDRVAHAYLFTGARGVGKTSMARILAKALNCPAAENGNPCNHCEMCRAISTGSDVDVLEIDGASNRGIDDIRALRANVGIRSMRTRIKLYIIDEVHMLTKEAFNALLKTLEEPPPNVKFVFCTTEPQKVPDTILSRCQRFDFSSIATQAIAERLADIALQEGVEVANDAVELVARRAGGSMRDSQSLFDQLLAFGSDRIESADVNRLLGTADDERLLELLSSMVRKDLAQILQQTNEASQAGVQLSNLVDQLVNLFRDLMVVKAGAEGVELLSVSPSQREVLQSTAGTLGMQTLMAAMQILSETKMRLARVPHTRALVDLAFVRISLLEDLDDLTQLIQQASQNPGAVPAAPPQKKSPDLTSREQTVPSAQSPPSPPPAVAIMEEPVEVIPFSEAELPRIWQRLLERIEHGIRNHLKQATKIVATGPSRILAEFESRFAFSHEYFRQKPESLRQIEKVLEEICGQPLQLKLELGQPAVTTHSERPVKESAPAVKNEFVRQAEQIFGASIARSERVRRN